MADPFIQIAVVGAITGAAVCLAPWFARVTGSRAMGWGMAVVVAAFVNAAAAFGPALIAGAGANSPPGERLQRDLSKLPVFRFMAKHEPVLYRDALQQMELIVLQRRVDPFAHAHEIGSAYGRQLLKKYAPRASDDSVIAFARLTRDTTARLQRENDGSCFRFLLNESEGMRRATQIIRDLPQKAASVSADVLSSAAEQPQKEPDDRRALQLLEQVVQRAMSRVGQGAMKELALLGSSKSVAQQQIACSAFVALMEETLRLDRVSAGIVLRHYLGQS